MLIKIVVSKKVKSNSGENNFRLAEKKKIIIILNTEKRNLKRSPSINHSLGYFL